MDKIIYMGETIRFAQSLGINMDSIITSGVIKSANDSEYLVLETKEPIEQ